MPDPLRDADILRALPWAKGDNREVLILSLGESEGIEGPAQLRQLYASETGHARSAALGSLARRCGAEATDLLTDGLRSRSLELQGTAASALAEHGPAYAADAVFEWLSRRLGSKGRKKIWDPYEIPSAIRFAVRHDLCADVARIIASHWDQLHEEERQWLRRTWPSLFDAAGSPVASTGIRPPDQVQADVFADVRGTSRGHDDTGASEKVFREYVQKALKNATRNRLRAHRDD